MKIKPKLERHPALHVPVCCSTFWKISSPSVLVRSRHEKNPCVFITLERERAGISSAASTSLPRHNSPGQHPRASPSGSWCQTPPLQRPTAASSTSGSFITLAMSSSIAPVTVILAGSSLCGEASHGGNRFLDYEPDVSGRMGTQKGEERISEGEGNYALTSFPLSVLGLFLTYCAL